MFDRITNIQAEGGEHGLGFVTAELDVTPDLWFFACHFPGDPVMPGCLGLDAMWQLVGFFLGWRGGPGKGRALGVNKVKFKGEVLDNCKLVTYQIDFKRIIERGKLIMGFADGKVYVDGKHIYTAESAGRFNSAWGQIVFIKAMKHSNLRLCFLNMHFLSYTLCNTPSLQSNDIFILK